MGKVKPPPSSSPSDSTVVPPPRKVLRSNYINADDYSSRPQLALIHPPTTAATVTSRYSKFQLPNGWGVQEVPRSNTSRVDKYYYEPGTGLKFRSLRAIERYVNGEEYTPRPGALTWHDNHYKCSEHRKMIICGGKMMRLNEEPLSGNHLAIAASRETAAMSPYDLPDGWVVEEVPRKNDSQTDKYYYEPGSGRKFRSCIGAKRYIAELKEDIPLSAALAEIKEMNRPLSKAFKLGRLVKNSISCKKQCARSKTQTSSLVSVPVKVNWVLASPQGDVWNPFIFNIKIPVSVKQQWNERFRLALNVENHSTPNSGKPS
ncbi:methyl-CpG-binding domain-containing protein 7-like [Coffea arabica]|uniref:Methyl-CpG-binding domain-containing protein 7-like n=1 Tax=Coffea arabica TaxID=13443 RepID=A0A6P6XF59_COFAR